MKGDSWRKFYIGRQRATEEMIEGLGRAFPHFVMWLICGGPNARENYFDPKTFMAIKKFNIDDILCKEPREISDEELLVVKYNYPDLDNPGVGVSESDDGLFSTRDLLEMRDRRLTREQFLKEQFDKATGKELDRLKLAVFGFRGDMRLPAYLENAKWLAELRDSTFGRPAIKTPTPRAPRYGAKKATKK